MMRLRILILSALSALGMLTALPETVSAQSAGTLLDSPVCRDNPHTEDCICAEVRRFGFFPKEMDPSGNGQSVDTDTDGFRPGLVDGIWLDHHQESEEYKLAVALGNDTSGMLTTELAFVPDDRYGQHCSLSYFRENLRRLWIFGVALGAVFTSVSVIWIGVVHMQNSASGIDISRTRMMLTRVGMGIIILACSLIIWEGLSDFILQGIDSWTQERGVFHDFRAP